MTCALSACSNPTSLVALLAKKPNQTDPTTNANAKPTRRTPQQTAAGMAGDGNGISAQSLFQALIGALKGDTASKDAAGTAITGAASAAHNSASGGQSSVLATLVSAADTNGDGILSVDEIQNAVKTLQCAQSSAEPDGPPSVGQAASDPARTDAFSSKSSTTSTATSTAKSLYESLFNAFSAEAGNSNTFTVSNTSDHPFLASVKVAA